MFEFDFEAAPKESNEITSLQLALNSVHAEMAGIKESGTALRHEIETRKGAVAELRARIGALLQEVYELEQEIKPINEAYSTLAREAENIEREIGLARARAAAAKELEDKVEDYSKRTQNFAWNGQLMQHQTDGAYLIAAGEKVIVADDMGLGKTAEVLAALDMMQAEKILWLCPADLCKNFEAEVTRWAPHRGVISLYKMDKPTRQAMMQIIIGGNAPIVVVANYESWRKDSSLVDSLIAIKFDAIVMDEAHNLKNATTDAFIGVKEIVLNDIHQPRYIIPVTGTPILNRPQELWPLLKLILPEVFHDERSFLSMYCRHDIYTGKWEWRPSGQASIVSHLGGRYLRRTREQAGVKLPPCSEIVHEIPFDKDAYPIQARLNAQLTKFGQMMLENGGSITALQTITLILRKRQMMTWPGGIELKDGEGNVIFSVKDDCQESIKMDKAQELIEEAVRDGRRLVLFSQFATALTELNTRLNLAGVKSVIFDGRTPDYQREEIKQDFNRLNMTELVPNYKYDIVLCNYKVGGVGLNFTAATECIIFDEPWNGGTADQAYKRIDRIGQTEETTIHILRVAGTIDTWMADLIAEKRAIVGGWDKEASDISAKMLDSLRRGDI